MRLYHGDCLEILPTLPAQSVDMILCDPPYGTTACKWDSVIPFAPMWAAIERVIKPNGAIVLFGSQPFTSALVMSKPEWFKYCWYWEKPRGSNFQLTAYQPLRVVEEISVFSGGGVSSSAANPMAYYPQRRKLDNPYTRDFDRNPMQNVSDTAHVANKMTGLKTYTHLQPRNLIYAATDNDRGLHPTQKPVALLAYLIRTYTGEGETVLDFTMGSGSTGVACIEEARRFIGIEKDAAYFDIARQRLEAEQSKPRTVKMELVS